MLLPEKTCLNCFSQLNEPKGVCPHCGCDNATLSNEAHQIECGSILAGTYLVGKVLGQGGFGITYAGWDLNLDIKVAIKEYYPEGCVTRDTHTHISVLTYAGAKEAYFQKGKERFVEEARSLAKFAGDSGVVGVRTFFYENGTAYIVMDFVEGETLKSYAARSGGKLPAAEVFALFRPLLTSIERVHNAGLLHRDISPDNIILKTDGRLALLDFGAARQMSLGGEHSNTINVKHGFAPEEQYRTRGEQGPWTDVYATSATIYRLITGQMPPQALDRLYNEDELVAPSALGIVLSEQQEKAILHGLAPRATDRTRSMLEFAEELYGDSAADRFQPLSQQPDDHGAEVLAQNPAALHPLEPAVLAEESGWKEAEKQIYDDLVKNTQKKKRGIVIAAVAAALFVIFVIIVPAVRHSILLTEIQEISDEIDRGDYYSALAVADGVEQKNDEYDTAIYGFAKSLLANGQYEAADSMKDRIVDTSRFDMASIEDGITYQTIKDALSQGDYGRAETLVQDIQNPSAYDLNSVKTEIATQRIEELFSNKKYFEAVLELQKLESSDKMIMQILIEEHVSELYEYGIELYHARNTTIVKTLFSMLGLYRRSSDYLLLIDTKEKAQADQLSWNLGNGKEDSKIKEQLEDLIDILDFEDASDILMYNSDTAFLFLLGEWRGGPSYIKFYTDAGSWWAQWEVTGIPHGHWNFKKRDLYITDSKDVEKKIARFTIVDKDSIEIFVYSSERTYSLKRV